MALSCAVRALGSGATPSVSEPRALLPRLLGTVKSSPVVATNWLGWLDRTLQGLLDWSHHGLSRLPAVM